MKPITAADIRENRREGEGLMDTKKRLEAERGIPPATDISKLGEIIPAGKLFISQHVGRAEGGEFTFEMLTGLGGNPMVKCIETGKTFSLGWHDLLEFAVARGVTTP